MSRREVALGLALGVLLSVAPGPGSAQAATTVRIQTLNYVFPPDPATARLGENVEWRNPTNNQHTTTDRGPLLLWDSGLMPPNTTFSHTVTAAGTYPYYCALHERFGMFATLLVKDVASPRGGPVGTVFHLRVASVPAENDFTYDIQRQDPGGGFLDWMSVSDPSVLFDSTGLAPGAYRFRSRLRRVSDGAATMYAPPLAIPVTP